MELRTGKKGRREQHSVQFYKFALYQTFQSPDKEGYWTFSLEEINTEKLDSLLKILYEKKKKNTSTLTATSVVGL